ncbi:putative ABC transporter permease [Serinicoccus hydrothermalis]|uniref:Putative ABC transporter permease n=1 Tax=Serinicoccus hydrothermalis TaxID=1758689 RepID=A0A1B1ND45_9MICO|nr:ABC transporter permease [Serinicoccus hydrothermalis]ANS79311.1 putative ABC transporter permease [Serinicoccus hydrothermalis]
MSTDTATASSTKRARLSREDLGLLLGLPILCTVVLVAWAIWRATADLDDIEQRALAWGNILTLTGEHLLLTVVGALVVVVTAIPIGIALTRPGMKRFATPVIGVANAGQAAPVIGVIVLFAMWLSFGFWTAILALSLYSFLPVLRNTIVGLQSVDPTLVEAARGMGMSNATVLRRVELPLAMPVIMTGVRTALVLLVGTAAFGTFISAGGLGALIVVGITLFRSPILISGGLLMAVLALLVDWAGRVLEFLATPKGMS